ncbi:MAG: DUF4325 domain-containing protein [Parcubacteria group bacterium]
MLTNKKILQKASKKGKVRTADFAKDFGVSRQYASQLIRQLVDSGQLIKVGSTRSALYVPAGYAEKHPEVLPAHFSRVYRNRGLEEHKVLDEVERSFAPLRKVAEPVKDIFTYALSEMFNNAIEHSRSTKISLAVFLEDNTLCFIIDDAGIGVYRNIMHKKHLQSPFEAIQDLLKGKTTTHPQAHSGEGIFFTSKAADTFTLDSYGYQMIINNLMPDVFVKKVSRVKRGTRVTFKINKNSGRHLSDVFRKFTDGTSGGDYGFDKTEIYVKLYAMGSVHISRSQARRILYGLDKFKVIVLDFDNVSMVGQAFADEIYRVFASKHPAIKVQEQNMNEAVAFMVRRAKVEAVANRLRRR